MTLPVFVSTNAWAAPVRSLQKEQNYDQYISKRQVVDQLLADAARIFHSPARVSDAGFTAKMPSNMEQVTTLLLEAHQLEPYRTDLLISAANAQIYNGNVERAIALFEQALTAGFTAVGMDVYLLGPMPTPAVAMLTRSLRADLGVMISASHNPFADNGIKLFGPDGYKLSDELELEIEELLDKDIYSQLAKPNEIGRAKRVDGDIYRYIEFVKRTLPRDVTLNGLRIAIHRPGNGDTLVILVVEDNLVKGASGQGVQCLNLMFGLPETLGLTQIALSP